MPVPDTVKQPQPPYILYEACVLSRLISGESHSVISVIVLAVAVIVLAVIVVVVVVVVVGAVPSQC